MKSFIQFLATAWRKLSKGRVSRKHSKLDSSYDAIGFPYPSKEDILEDYEMAAYHQQA
jgi:hypothetical protein